MRRTPRSPRLASTAVDPPDLIVRLLAGDEALFASLVERWQSGLLRLARSFTGNGATAEEVVQETWAAVLKSLHTFEGRSSLRTWVHCVCAHLALGCVRQEDRAPVPIGPLVELSGVDEDDACRDSLGRWTEETPEAIVARREVMHCIARAVVSLPSRQRAVITLRDVQGFSSAEACHILGVTEVHQRVLLHRARTRVRAACEALDREAA